MKKKIWFMEGLSSQRDIILGVKSFAEKENHDIEIFSSHRNERKEILSVSDFSMIEPNNEEERLSFIHSITDAHGINAIHTGRNCKWFESHRENIQRSGVHLTTGSTGTHWFELADEKLLFPSLWKKWTSGCPVGSGKKCRRASYSAESSPFPF